MANRVDKVKNVLGIMYLEYGLTEKVVKLSQFLDKLILEEQIKMLDS